MREYCFDLDWGNGVSKRRLQAVKMDPKEGSELTIIRTLPLGHYKESGDGGKNECTTVGVGCIERGVR